jgi:hypothetical protein
MCLRTTDVRPLDRWNWGGDQIVPDTTIRARRPNPATKRRYRVDIREFLSTTSNAILHDALDDIVAGLTPSEQALFRSRKPGAFDLRVRAVTSYVAEHVAYAKKDRAAEAWLFPDETLDARRGDCEDLAFLLAALLLATGLSGYVVRVALGAFREAGTKRATDHAWVVYRDERGRWLLLDPLLFTQDGASAGAAKRRPRRAKRYDYEPRFVFNDQHLWAMRPARGVVPLEQYASERTYWDAFDPTFAAGVHDKIYDSALADMSWARRNWVKAVSLALDGDTTSYHPYDHFDDAYVGRGFDLVRRRLATGNLTDFASATHAIADFYAHSSYGHFAIGDDGTLPHVDEQTADDGPAPGEGVAPDYSTGVFAFTRFTRNDEHADLTPAQAAQLWAGKWISGRYGQPDDQEAGFFERVMTPYPDDLETSAELDPRACLPHHNEIAVDESGGGSVPKKHRLYATAKAYQKQFDARFAAASQHVADVYQAWRARGFDA